jgi:hypothetical protein
MQCNDTSLILNILLRNFFVFFLCDILSIFSLLYVQRYSTVEMHGLFVKREASTESRDTVISP